MDLAAAVSVGKNAYEIGPAAAASAAAVISPIVTVALPSRLTTRAARSPARRQVARRDDLARDGRRLGGQTNNNHTFNTTPWAAMARCANRRA